ncbi:hypothetical protein F5Y09DRAFT_50773 [Xylaria sp. FL1042]|nr:hypothetical protein F5Y09DRAFT_50773 [Xylaria sp. FL1042]
MSWSDRAMQGSGCSTKSSVVSSAYGMKASLQSHRLDVNWYTATKFRRALEEWVLEVQNQDDIRARIIEVDKQFRKSSGGCTKRSVLSLEPNNSQPGNLQSKYNFEISGSGAWCLSSARATNLPYRPRHAEASRIAFQRFYSIWRWSQDWVARWASRALPHQEGDNYGSTSGTVSPNSEQSQQQQQRKDKRKRKDEKQEPGPGRGHGGSDGQPTVKKSRDEKLRLACPFFKRNPMKYAGRRFCLHHWPNTSRLKEHLYQQHILSGIQCALCGVMFDSPLDFQAHQLQRGACERTFEPLEGIDALTKMKLQDKKVARGATEEAKWLAIYAILFPRDDSSTYPDPYHDLSPISRQQIVTSLQDQIPLLVQNAVSQAMDNANTGILLDANELQTAITTSINGFLQRFQLDQLPFRNTEAEVDDPKSLPVLSVDNPQAILYQQSQVLTENSSEFAGSDTMEDLLCVFHPPPGNNERQFEQFIDYSSGPPEGPGL